MRSEIGLHNACNAFKVKLIFNYNYNYEIALQLFISLALIVWSCLSGPDYSSLYQNTLWISPPISDFALLLESFLRTIQRITKY